MNVPEVANSLFFHGFDPDDALFSHNIYVGQGRITAVSLAREFRPDWSGIMSPYEAFTRERPKEEAFEAVRSEEFPHCPPRLGSIFLFPSREAAETCNREWWSGRRVILKARILASSLHSSGTFDSRHLDSSPDQWLEATRKYWRAEVTRDPRPEVVVCGTIQLIGWEEHAKLWSPDAFG